jgi:hypothetical protein
LREEQILKTTQKSEIERNEKENYGKSNKMSERSIIQSPFIMIQF